MNQEIQTLKALADTSRMRIIKMLEQREMCVCEIVAALELAQPTVSKHLKILSGAGIITARRNGSWMHYALSTQASDPFTQSLLQLVAGHMNDDENIKGLVARLPELNPQTLKCPK